MLSWLTQWSSWFAPSIPTNLPRYTSLEQHYINGRGALYLLANPTTGPRLPFTNGQQILLDGHPVRIDHVEGFCKHGLFHQGDRIAIIVSPLTQLRS